MILVDTAVWIEHLREINPTLLALLNDDRVLMHPFIIGEIAVGNLCHRDLVLQQLHELTISEVATDHEVLEFIGHHRLYGLGIGYVDCHLLAGVMLTPGASFWTRDKRLLATAARLGVAATLLDKPNGTEP